MKFKTTKKAINNGYYNRIEIPYCALQTLLDYELPVAYTTRAEGWGADVYQVNGSTAIITGYAPFGNIRPDYETVKRYETAAEKIRYSREETDKADKLHALLIDFVNEVTRV